MKEEIYQPSDSELEILQIMWDSEPITVRSVHDELLEKSSKSVRYTTVLKQMQRLFAKGVVKRTLAGKTHIYTTVLKQQEVQQNLYRHFVERVFQGSARKLVMHALGNKETSEDEIKALQQWIQQQKKNEDG